MAADESSGQRSSGLRGSGDDPADESEDSRAESTEALWSDVGIDPVEIALPGGVGYTLRAYRSSAELEPSEIERGAEDLDDFDAASAAVARRRRSLTVDAEGESLDEADEPLEEPRARRSRRSQDEDDDDMAADALDDDDRELTDEEIEAALAEEDEEDEEPAEPEEVPIFLGRNGRLYLFHSPEKLVEFVRSGAETELSQLDTWSDLTSRITVEDIVARDEDSYELDLVVENLRGGSDAWDPALLLKAGEVARDLGYALRLETVLNALASGSPLDDLDEALRAAESGGVGGFFAKRKLRKIAAQQASLAWRTVIGKIAAAADWRD